MSLAYYPNIETSKTNDGSFEHQTILRIERKSKWYDVIIRRLYTIISVEQFKYLSNF